MRSLFVLTYTDSNLPSSHADDAWIRTNFADCLTKHGFYCAFADYEEHSSETFDPCDKVFENYGINSIRNTIQKTCHKTTHLF